MKRLDAEDNRQVLVGQLRLLALRAERQIPLGENAVIGLIRVLGLYLTDEKSE